MDVSSSAGSDSILAGSCREEAAGSRSRRLRRNGAVLDQRCASTWDVTPPEGPLIGLRTEIQEPVILAATWQPLIRVGAGLGDGNQTHELLTAGKDGVQGA